MGQHPRLSHDLERVLDVAGDVDPAARLQRLVGVAVLAQVAGDHELPVLHLVGWRLLDDVDEHLGGVVRQGSPVGRHGAEAAADLLQVVRRLVDIALRHEIGDVEHLVGPRHPRPVALRLPLADRQHIVGLVGADEVEAGAVDGVAQGHPRPLAPPCRAADP